MAGVDITGFEMARRKEKAAELNVSVEQVEETEAQEEVKRRGRPPKQEEGLTAKVGE